MSDAPVVEATPADGPAPGRLERLTGGLPAYPLLVLFGLTLVDELNRSAFNVLLPDIRDAFGLDNSGILSVVAVAGAAALLLTIPIAQLADRYSRVRLALLGALVWAAFTFGTGLAPVVWVLIVAQSGASIGQAVVFPTHNSLLADYYRTDVRPRIYALHRAGNAIGIMIGTGVGAVLAAWFNWRVPFIVFGIPGVLLVLAGLKLREPVRGRFEREASGAGADLADVEDEPVSYGEAWRMVWKIRTLRRIFVALPFLAASIIGFASLASLQYAETFDLDQVQRAMIGVPVELLELAGLAIGARYSVKLLAKGPSAVFRLIAASSVVSAVLAVGFALAPNVGVAIAFHALIVGALAIVGPGVLASLSLAIPPRARSVGFSIGALFILPGLVVIPLAGVLGDHFGYRWGLLVLTPVFTLGGLFISTVGKVIDEDIHDVWLGATARAEMMQERAAGRLELLRVRGVEVAYGDVQVLFGVDLDVAEGEVIALLGTNGAGKSTLLKAISGVAEAHRGAVIFDGRDITHAPPEEIAPRGIAQVPGGQGVFPSLSVAENLRAAGWQLRKDAADRVARVEEALDLFPVLRARLDDPAADLSGGQQQMLALAMAFLSRPRLLMIDELSLGLAPVVVEQLLGVVRAFKESGTTIILVEQSVNVALTVADTAYFMEKGEIRFHGPTAELLDRPDVLRSVFLEGAAKGLAADAAGGLTLDHAAPVGNGTTVTARSRPSEPVGTADGPAATAAAPALAVQGLGVAFGGIRAVSDVSLDVAPGEILGIIGPNGAGKTTLFDLISGVTAAHRGRVELDGRDVTAMAPHRRARLGLGRSFQDSRLFPSLTVEDALLVSLERWLDVRDPFNAVLRTPALLQSEAAGRHRVDELIELMGIEAFRTKFVGELSTGSRRVVDLACVLAHGPQVVLLDEPSSGIAQREAEALGPLLERIRDELGASLLVIEHDMGLVSGVADRMLALDQGRVVTVGTPAEVLAHEQVVASYLGSDPDALARSGPARPADAAPPTDQPSPGVLA